MCSKPNISSRETNDSNGTSNLRKVREPVQSPQDSSHLQACGVQGSWPRLAALMGVKPDLAILRRFSKLNALRLLEMQSELMQLEEELDYVYKLDAAEECPITRSYQFNWEALNESKGNGGAQQREIWQKLRDKLEVYNHALLQEIQISAHKGPSSHDLSLLQDWLGRKNGNNSSLRGRGWNAWEEGESGSIGIERDYVVLSSKHKGRDHLSRWLGDSVLGTFHSFIGRRIKRSVIPEEEFGLTEYSDTRISVAADLLCSLIAPLLTTVPMFVLLKIELVETRIGFILGFTTLFSISLILFSSASRTEIFAATSAFAAVQVVFVGTVN